MSESLGKFLLEMREEHKDEMETGLKTKYIGYWGEIFAYNYLENLFERNGIRNYKIIPHKNDHDDYDLEVSINDRSYKIEIKFSTKEKEPIFDAIHFNNNFDFFFLIWSPSNEEIYFAILTKEEARKIAIPHNKSREDDNWTIQTTEIFEETNENFLKRLSEFLELNEKLEDLEENEKTYLIEKAEELVIKEHKDAQINDFKGEVYQQWIYDYLSNYVDDTEIMPRGYKYDIRYKGKGIEIKYSSLNNDDGAFKFNQIKPEDFDFIFFIGFDKKENKFYFEIESREEFKENKKENVGSDDAFSQNGNQLHVTKSFFTYGNDFTFEDFNNYIESH